MNVNNIRLLKKNEDGSYDNSDKLFKQIDVYGGDHQKRILEISPGINEQQIKHVYFSLELVSTDGNVTFVPEREGSYYLTNSLYKNIKFYLEHKSGHKLYPDKKGMIKITDLLIKPMDVVLHVEVEQYAMPRITEGIIFDDIEIVLNAA